MRWRLVLLEADNGSMGGRSLRSGSGMVIFGVAGGLIFMSLWSYNTGMITYQFTIQATCAVIQLAVETTRTE